MKDKMPPLVHMKHTPTTTTSCHGDIWSEGVGGARAEVKLNDACRAEVRQTLRASSHLQ